MQSYHSNFTIFVLLLGLSACAGIADYTITLIQDYDVVRTSEERIRYLRKYILKRFK